MDKNQTPARGIMSTGNWDDAHSYRVACECHDHAHDLNVWIEVDPDKETQDITVYLYKEMYTPFWGEGFNRVREAMRLLFTGHSRHESSIIMRREVAENFLSAVQSSINELGKKS